MASSSWNNFTQRCCQHAQSVLPACDVNRQCNSKRIKQLYVSEKRSVLLQIPRLMLRKVNQTPNRNRGCFPLPTPSDQRPKYDAKFALLKKILKYFLQHTHTHTPYRYVFLHWRRWLGNSFIISIIVLSFFSLFFLHSNKNNIPKKYFSARTYWVKKILVPWQRYPEQPRLTFPKLTVNDVVVFAFGTKQRQCGEEPALHRRNLAHQLDP